jgi:class 3 adenylate cyclase
VFDGVFDDLGFGSAAGLSGGPSYIANIGKHGERELISLGKCANLAAKCLGKTDTITITKDVYDVLPNSLKELFTKGSVVSGVQSYRSTGLRWSEYPELAEELGVKWNEGRWRKKTEEYRDDLPLDEIEISEALALIDLESLTERKCKRTAAVAFFADLDGFTRYVQEAEDDDKVVSLIRQFHMIRAEFQSVIADDYEGLVIQHRGDCTLAILHMPCGDDKHSKRCKEAVDVAIGLQSSMERVLNAHLPDRKDIHVAVGLDVGKAFVTRLGKKGRRIGICFGPEVSVAEALQRSTGAKKIRISEAIYEELDDEDLKSEFVQDGDTYVATNLTFPRLDRIREERAANDGSLGAAVKAGGIVVTSKASPATGAWQNSQPWRSR